MLLEFCQTIPLYWEAKLPHEHVYSINNVLVYVFRMCPIFQVSNVSGENLDLLKSFLNLLSTRVIYDERQPAEFQIDDTFLVPVSVYHC